MRLWIIAEEKRQNGLKLIEKSGLSHLHSFVIVICSAYFGPQKCKKYTKSVGVNKSENVEASLYRHFTTFLA